MIKLLSVMPVAFLASFCAIANAQNSGTINFTGNVTASACQLSSDSKLVEVPLGNIPGGLFRNGLSSEWVNFEIHLNNCEIGSIASAKFTDINHSPNQASTVIQNAGSSNGIGIEIAEEQSEQPLEFISGQLTHDFNSSAPTQGENGSIIQKFKARMTGTDPQKVTPGSVRGQLTFEITYK